MPLHLLGKKSWNVYNADNIARVRRDEAAAQAAEEAEEQRMQENDAQRRLAILRGEVPAPLPDKHESEPAQVENAPSAAPHGGPRRKRKRQGEDDTDFELRLAQERDKPVGNSLEATPKPTSSAPLTDRAGHFDLFGDSKNRAHAEKNEEAEKEKKKKQREYEDQYTMRFANAPGKHGTNRPWYSQAEIAAETTPKNVWGNEDPKRKDRETARLMNNDPLAVMKTAASKVRELNQERKKLQDEQDEELRQLRREDRRREKRAKRDDEKSKGTTEPGKSDRRHHRSKERHHRDDDRHRRRHRDEEGRHREENRRHRHAHD